MRISNPPSARDLMLTSRSFGNYDLPAALADLIDNSIKAAASNVSILFEPVASDIVVRIRDDGAGMDKASLIAAMRPASANPEVERHPEDLGRFGWGLKSASLSQARVLSVVTWQADSIFAARWDIDDIDDWTMDFTEGSAAEELLSAAVTTPSGTEVIWSNTDRLLDIADGESFSESFTAAIAHAMQRLSLTFHRYLEGESRRRLAIIVNGTVLPPLDPFMRSHDATQTLDAEQIAMPSGAIIHVQPYVLPHFSKLTLGEQEKLGGPEGMVRNQGFYVYRNKRLIIYGTWFRLVPHGELSQLTRVRIDLPNSSDAEWRITLDKSDAQLPPALKRRLKEIVRKFNRRSVSVHRKKGVAIDHPEYQSVWVREVKNGQIRYLVNRVHPMVSHLLEIDTSIGDVDAVLRLLESYFPVDRFLEDGNSAHSAIGQSGTSTEEFEALIQQCVLNYLQQSDGRPDVEDFINFIRAVEPFASQWKYTESFVRENIARQWGMNDGL